MIGLDSKENGGKGSGYFEYNSSNIFCRMEHKNEINQRNNEEF